MPCGINSRVVVFWRVQDKSFECIEHRNCTYQVRISIFLFLLFIGVVGIELESKSNRVRYPPQIAMYLLYKKADATVLVLIFVVVIVVVDSAGGEPPWADVSGSQHGRRHDRKGKKKKKSDL